MRAATERAAIRRGWVCGDPARLGVADQARRAQTEREADFRQLRGLAGAGFAAHHDDLVIADRGGDGLAMSADRQAVVELRRRQRGAALPQPRGGGGDVGAQPLQLAIRRLVLAPMLAQVPQAARERRPVAKRTVGQARLQRNQQVFHEKPQMQCSGEAKATKRANGAHFCTKFVRAHTKLTCGT